MRDDQQVKHVGNGGMLAQLLRIIRYCQHYFLGSQSEQGCSCELQFGEFGTAITDMTQLGIHGLSLHSHCVFGRLILILLALVKGNKPSPFCALALTTTSRCKLDQECISPVRMAA